MYKRLSLIFLLICVVISQGCKSGSPQLTTTEIESTASIPAETPLPLENETQIFSDGKVKFKGVSFTFNHQIFGRVEAQEFTEVPYRDLNDKGDYVHPQYRSFHMYDAKQNKKGYVEVYPVKDFRKMYLISEEAVGNIDQDTIQLQRIIKNKNLRNGKKIPVLQSFDRSEELLVKVENVSFQNGRGVFFVTHWNYEFALMSNENLSYVFEGITNDGYYILAEMPISVGFLPETSPKELEGYKITYMYEDFKEWGKVKNRYKNYCAKIAGKLEKLKSNDFKPHLSEFEKIISSLKIEK